MSKTNNPRGSIMSYSEVKDILIKICNKNIEKDQILVTANEVVSELKIQNNKEVSRQTVRNYGISPRSYFEKVYSDACSYNSKGDTKYRGLMIKPKKFLKQMKKEDRFSGEIPDQ